MCGNEAQAKGRLSVVMLAIVALLAACNSPGEMVSETVPTAEHTVTASATPSPTDTATSVPTATPPPTATAELPATPAPAVPATPQPQATATAPVAGLPCPDPPPTRPAYTAYTQTESAWPAPGGEPIGEHLSLVDPLPVGERNLTYPYGSDGSGRYVLHNGLDMAAGPETPAFAAGGGRVVVARSDAAERFGWRCDWYGNLIIIELAGTPGVYLLYGHLSDFQVAEGQVVERGQSLGFESAVGAAVVPHVHFEVRVGDPVSGSTRNPLLWVRPPLGHGIVAGRVLDPDGRAWQGVLVTLIDRQGELPFVNTWTYLDDPEHLVQPDEALAENFVFGPMPAGSYDVHVRIQAVDYRQTVEIREGEITTLEIVTDPLRETEPAATTTP